MTLSSLDWLSDDARDELVRIIDERIERALGATTSRRWMTVDEAAEYLRLTPTAVRRRIERRTIPSTRLEGRVLVDREELDRKLSS